MATIEFGSVTEGIPGVAGLAIVMVFMLFVVVRTVSRRRGELARMRAADAARAEVAEKSPKMYDVHIGEGADVGALDGWEKIMVRPRYSFSVLGAALTRRRSCCARVQPVSCALCMSLQESPPPTPVRPPQSRLRFSWPWRRRRHVTPPQSTAIPLARVNSASRPSHDEDRSWVDASTPGPLSSVSSPTSYHPTSNPPEAVRIAVLVEMPSWDSRRRKARCDPACGLPYM